MPQPPSCINNLRQIRLAKEQWVIEKNKTTNDVPAWADASDYLRSGIRCPQGGTYMLGRVCEPPKCSIGGPTHTLPDE